jgi:hypothetical protein
MIHAPLQAKGVEEWALCSAVCRPVARFNGTPRYVPREPAPPTCILTASWAFAERFVVVRFHLAVVVGVMGWLAGGGTAVGDRIVAARVRQLQAKRAREEQADGGL